MNITNILINREFNPSGFSKIDCRRALIAKSEDQNNLKPTISKSESSILAGTSNGRKIVFISSENMECYERDEKDPIWKTDFLRTLWFSPFVQIHKERVICLFLDSFEATQFRDGVHIFSLSDGKPLYQILNNRLYAPYIVYKEGRLFAHQEAREIVEYDLDKAEVKQIYDTRNRYHWEKSFPLQISDSCKFAVRLALTSPSGKCFYASSEMQYEVAVTNLETNDYKLFPVNLNTMSQVNTTYIYKDQMIIDLISCFGSDPSFLFIDLNSGNSLRKIEDTLLPHTSALDFADIPFMYCQYNGSIDYIDFDTDHAKQMPLPAGVDRDQAHDVQAKMVSWKGLLITCTNSRLRIWDLKNKTFIKSIIFERRQHGINSLDITKEGVITVIGMRDLFLYDLLSNGKQL